MKKIKFTLIELLVVISIIAIIASLVMPALNQSISAVRKASCMNNIKALGIAAVIYAGDNHGFLPSVNPYYPTFNWARSWPVGSLKNYFDSEKLLLCPVVSDRDSKTDAMKGYGNNPPCDYSMNWLNGGDVNDSKCGLIRINNVKNPSKAGFFVDGTDYSWYWEPYLNPYNPTGGRGVFPHSGRTDWRHDLSINVQLLDGHVESRFDENDFGSNTVERQYFWVWAWSR